MWSNLTKASRSAKSYDVTRNPPTAFTPSYASILSVCVRPVKIVILDPTRGPWPTYRAKRS